MPELLQLRPVGADPAQLGERRFELVLDVVEVCRLPHEGAGQITTLADVHPHHAAHQLALRRS